LAVAFDFIAISGLDIDGYRLGQGASMDTDFPPGFIEAYAAGGFVGKDPFVLAAKASKTVVIESTVWEQSPPPQRLHYLIRIFNVHNRTMIPVLRGNLVYGGVCFTRATAFTEDELDFLALIAEPIHSSVTHPLMERFASEEMKLTKGEIVCLEQASFGLTSDGIAKATGYQSDTVNSYIKTAVRKLDCTNRTQAIAEAIRRKRIP
jgi:LuxR family transcriptional regulator